jgi:hypothetical protein
MSNVMNRNLKLLLLAAAAVASPLLAEQQQAPSMRADPSASSAQPPSIDITQLDRIAQARTNLEGLIGGTIAIGALTQAELLDVLALESQLRGQGRDTRSPEQRCVDREVSRFNGRPSALERRVIDLKCRETMG